MISYSVAIRTMGTAGEKYEKLLKAVQSQTIQPEKIIVVLPEGYTPPEAQLGIEEFVYSKKGMVYQRIVALDYITSDYILFCDDDVEPEPRFVEKLSDSLQNEGYACATGPLLDFFPPNGVKEFLASILGFHCVMLHGRKSNYVRILGTGGWSYNRSIETDAHKIYDTQSLAWTCFFVNAKAMRDIHLEDELWLEQNGYAAYDDQVMFYKLFLNGYKICVVSDAVYLHHDGRTSKKNLKTEPIYAAAFAHYVFWHRFLYSQAKGLKKLWLKICITYYLNVNAIHRFFLLKRGKKTKEEVEAMKCGLSDSKKFIKSEGYKNMPSAKTNARGIG